MPKKWTPEDEAYLVANYNKVAIEELAKQFGVSKKAVRVKYGKLRDRPDFHQLAQKAPDEPPQPAPGTQPRGPRKWSEDDERYLLANYNTMSLDELAKHFGVTKKAVRVKYGKIKHKAAELVPDKGLSEAEQLQVGPRHWTEEDENFLLQHYEDLGPDAMAEHFGISKQLVTQKFKIVKEKRRPTLHIPRYKGEAPRKSLQSVTHRRKPLVPKVSMSMTSTRKRNEEQIFNLDGTTETHLMVMTKKGWEPLSIQKRRVGR